MFLSCRSRAGEYDIVGGDHLGCHFSSILLSTGLQYRDFIYVSFHNQVSILSVVTLRSAPLRSYFKIFSVVFLRGQQLSKSLCDSNCFCCRSMRSPSLWLWIIRGRLFWWLSEEHCHWRWVAPFTNVFFSYIILGEKTTVYFFYSPGKNYLTLAVHMCNKDVIVLLFLVSIFISHSAQMP